MKELEPNPQVPKAMKDLYLAELTEHTKTQCSSDPPLGTGPIPGEILSSSLLQERRRSITKGFKGDPEHGLQLAHSKYINLERSLQFRLNQLQRIMEKQTGSSLLTVSPLPFSKKQKTLKKHLRQGKNYLLFT